jgi:hypothetical protein
MITLRERALKAEAEVERLQLLLDAVPRPQTLTSDFDWLCLQVHRYQAAALKAAPDDRHAQTIQKAIYAFTAVFHLRP